MLSSLCLCYDDISCVHFIVVHKHPLRGVILPYLCTQGIKQQGVKVSYNRIVFPSDFSSSCDKAGIPRCRRPLNERAPGPALSCSAAARRRCGRCCAGRDSGAGGCRAAAAACAAAVPAPCLRVPLWAQSPQGPCSFLIISCI